MAPTDLSAGLAEKVNEYRVMSAPLDQAIRELEYAQTLLKARAESDIAQTVPCFGRAGGHPGHLQPGPADGP